MEASSSSSFSGEILFKDFKFEDLEEIPISLEDFKTKSTFEKFRDTVKINWYTLRFHLESLQSKLSPEEVAEIFKSPKSLINVHNYAKKSELDLYLGPALDVAGFKELGEQFGFYPEKEMVKIKPIDDGKCFSAVAYFFMKTYDEDPKKVAKEFEEGIPYKAALYQGVYDNFCMKKTSFAMEKLLKEIISGYPKAINKDTYWKNAEALWKKSFHDATLPILEATKAFLEDGKDITKHDYINYVKERIRPRLLTATPYGCVRGVAEFFTKKQISEQDRTRFGFGLAGLELEIVHENVSPKTIIDDLKSLKPGRYAIDIKIPGSRNKHIVGIQVDSKESCYFIDANSAVVEMKQEDLEDAVSKTFGKLYKIPVDGKKMPKEGYSLYKVSRP